MQFLFPGVLYGLFAISIPILIHLFNFRKYKTVYFSNTQYLRNIKQNSKSRNKLKHLLILIARILTIIFLVLAFSKPFIPTKQVESTSQNQIVGIYLDNSYSMEAESKFGKLTDVAKKRAIEISNSFDASTQFMFITNERKMLHNHFVNAEQLVDFIENTNTSPEFIALSDIIQHFIHMSELNVNKNDVKKKLFLISDFQKNIVDLEKITEDSLLSIVFLPLSTQKTNNIYIDSCWFNSPYRKYESEEILNVRIANNSSESYQNIPIGFYVNDSARAFSSINLEPNSSNVEQIKYTNTAKGLMKCMVEIQDYPIIHDNNYYFSYPIAESIRILNIYDEHKDESLEILFDLDNYFDYSQQNLSYIDYSQFESFDVIILDEINELSNVLINQILNYVKTGGRLVVIPSQKISIDSYNLFYSAFNNNLITGIDTNLVQIDKINFLSDIYVSTFDNVNEEHIYPELNVYFQNQSFSRSNSVSLIQSKNNFNLLNVTPYFSGDIFTFYFPHMVNKENFSVHPIYIPTFYNIALNSQNAKPLSYVIGKTNIIETEGPITNSENIVHILHTATNFEFIPRIELRNRLKIHLQNQLKSAGNYILKSENQVVDAFSFNYDKRESRLDYYSENELKELAELNNIQNLQFFENNSDSIIYSLSEINQGTQLWLYFILLSILFVVIEILLIKLMK
jgi:Aerotolerance regulator N-terminal